MPHRVAGRKLSRPHAHRLRMLENLAVAVLRYERVKTTEAKAKEVRGMVDRYITLAKKGDLSARRRLVAEMPHEPLIIDKLMGEIAEKYTDRTSGYTRIVKLGQRLGDAAPIVQIELV
jgi:large subunit ribosomal protein L17